MRCVVILGSGAAWEAEAVQVLGQIPGFVVLKRCVDVEDLMATCATGQAEIAVLSLDAPGLDPQAIAHLRRHHTRPVAVTSDPARAEAQARAARLNVRTVLGSAEIATLPGILDEAEAHEPEPSARATDPEAVDAASGHRVIAVWGAAGAPGRSTVATGLAGELGRRSPTILIDGDPWSASLAQTLGVLDETSALLSLARLNQSGHLAERFVSTLRQIDPGLALLSGLPRPDRWIEIPDGTMTEIIETAAQHGNVVVDTGFSVEVDRTADFATLPGRNSLTLEALACADEVVVVAAADPIGLARAARALVELREFGEAPAPRVVVNRMRSSLGWAESDISSMLQGFADVTGIHFLPEDRSSADRAAVAGQGIHEVREGALMRSLIRLTDAVAPGTQPSAPRRRRLSRRG